MKAGLAAATSVTVAGCITVSDSQTTQREVVDLVAPTAGTAPLPTTPAELHSELEALRTRLPAAQDGPTASQGPAREACLRLAALARDAISTAARERVGLSNFDYLLLLKANQECPADPGKAAQALTEIVEALPSPPAPPADR